MGTESKKHHFVPQSILKNFAADAKASKVYVFDKKLGKGYLSSIKDAGAENEFNTVSTEQGKINLEGIFDQADSNISKTARTIVNTNSFEELNFDDFQNLIDYVVVQYLRTKLRRDTISHIQKRHQEEVKKLDLNAVLDGPILSQEDIKLQTLLSLHDRSAYMEFFLDKTILLFKTDENNPFWISDNPVVKNNPFPYGGLGMKDKGVEIYLPISKNLIIAFWCNSIFEVWKQKKPHNIKSIEKFQQCIHAIPFSKENVDLVNKLQIAKSSRFVYSTNDQSKYIEQFLTNKPQYKEVDSDIIVGEMGQGPPTKKSMPKGVYLIVWIADLHYMIPIEMERKEVVISFFTKDIDQLKLIGDHKKFDKAEVYRDGKLIRSIPNAIIKELNLSGIAPSIISYADTFVEEIFRSVLFKKI